MKETFKEWMVQNPRVDGVLACGVRFPGVALENAWRCMADAYQVLTLHRLSAVRMRWVYETALLHCARRHDGIILGLFTSRNPDEVDAAGLEQLFASFEAQHESSALHISNA